jgi:phosphatidylserine decarboxylase
MTRSSIIAREGLLPVAVSVLAAVLVTQTLGIKPSLVFWLIALVLLLVFRDPSREIPAVPMAVVSPADGRVISISMTDDPYLLRQSIHIIIQMNSYGVFSTRSPVEGKVLEPPNIPKGKSAPHGVWLQTDEGDDVVLVMNRGRLHTAPRCYAQFGERIGQGQRCGFIHMGAQIDLYLPMNSRAAVSAGDFVKSGSDVVATLIH